MVEEATFATSGGDGEGLNEARQHVVDIASLPWTTPVLTNPFLAESAIRAGSDFSATGTQVAGVNVNARSFGSNVLELGVHCPRAVALGQCAWRDRKPRMVL